MIGGVPHWGHERSDAVHRERLKIKSRKERHSKRRKSVYDILKLSDQSNDVTNHVDSIQVEHCEIDYEPKSLTK